MAYFYLGIAILAEVIATSSMKASHHFTKFWPSLAVVIGYGCAFYFLSRVLDTIPVGLAYALWSGIGTALVCVVAAAVYRQMPDLPAIIGIALIVAGVVVLNVWSKMAVR